MREREIKGEGRGRKKDQKRGRERERETDTERGGPGLWAGPGVSRQMGECETGGTDARL